MKILPIKLSIEFFNKKGFYLPSQQRNKIYCITLTLEHYVCGEEVFTSYWSLNNYKKQWKQGLERLKKHDNSCLVLNIMKRSNIIENIVICVLYKTDRHIKATYLVYWGEKEVQTFLQSQELTVDNCYDFIPDQTKLICQKDPSKYRWTYIRRFPTYYV